MNALLLVTSAWLAGADPAPPPASPAPAPAAASAWGGNSCNSCGGGCNSCCEDEGWWSRLRNRFHRHDECCDTCNTCNTCGAPAAPAGPVPEKIPAPMPKAAAPEAKPGF